jgi:hypothetical protein
MSGMIAGISTVGGDEAPSYADQTSDVNARSSDLSSGQRKKQSII